MRQIVIFRLGKEEYGIDIIKVVEIVLHQEIRQVPDGPSYIEGIVNLRGDIHPIYNLNKRFKMKQEAVDEETKIIVLKTHKRDIGFVVDGVSEILNIPINDIQQAPDIISAGQQYIDGIAKYENRMIVLLDVDKLVSESDYETIDEIIKE